MTTRREDVKWTKESLGRDHTQYTYRNCTIVMYDYEKERGWHIPEISDDFYVSHPLNTVEQALDSIDDYWDTTEERHRSIRNQRSAEHIEDITKYAIDNYDAGWDFWVEMGDEDRLEIIRGAEAIGEAFKLALKYAGDEAEKRFCKADNASMFEWDPERYKELEERFNDFRKESA